MKNLLIVVMAAMILAAAGALADTNNFNIDILSPQAGLYDYTNQEDAVDYINMEVSIHAGMALDFLRIRLDDGAYRIVCEDCLDYTNAEMQVGHGTHTLYAQGVIDDIMRTRQVGFTVLLHNQTPGNDTQGNQTDDGDDDQDDDEGDDEGDDGNETGDPDHRFASGFEKLPQMLKSGEIDDQELADIIRQDALAPGIVNRLIKTGLLGNESINAILETQFNPPGILRKMLSFIGLSDPGYAQLIYDTYELSEENSHNMLERSDIQKKDLDKVKDSVKKNTGKNINKTLSLPAGKNSSERQSMAVMSVGSQGSPGKKASAGDDKEPKAKKHSQVEGKQDKGKDKDTDAKTTENYEQDDWDSADSGGQDENHETKGDDDPRPGMAEGADKKDSKKTGPAQENPKKPQTESPGKVKGNDGNSGSNGKENAKENKGALGNDAHGKSKGRGHILP